MRAINRLLPPIVAFVIFMASAAGIVLTVVNVRNVENALRRAQVDRTTVLRHQLDAETNLRGYVATKSVAFLQPYYAAVKVFDSSVATTRTDFAALNLPAAIGIIDEEARIHHQWIDRVAQPLVAHPNHPDALATELEGKRLVDRFRNDNDRIIDALDAKAALLEQNLQRTIGVLIGAGIGLGIAFSAVIYWYGYRRRQALEDAQRQTVLYEREREVATMLQRAVIDRQLPVVEGLTIDACYRAATQVERVGGDWFDVFALPDGRMLLIVGDVVGHGLAATLAMRDTRNAILGAALHKAQPGAILTAANHQLLQQRNDPEPVGTVICAYLDPAKSEVRYATAGHPPPIVVGAARALRLYEDGTLPLGFEEHEYATRGAPVPPGATLIFYTDGLTEFNRDAAEGEQRLIRCATELHDRDVDTLAQTVVSDVLDGVPPQDDIAVVAVTFTVDLPKQRG